MNLAQNLDFLSLWRQFLLGTRAIKKFKKCQNPKNNIVIIVRGGKPGIIHPGPQNSKKHKNKGLNSKKNLMFNEQMIQSMRNRGYSDYIHQIKKIPAASRRDAFLRVRDQPAGVKNS
ncbi:hypothetical protein BLM37_03600 [Candidatus Gracilibacteria bacterium GN02-873]|nr:hypothetical protein BLM37_03600 [Candidatus Gracilibacteria bacterium GN02-873]